MIAPIHSEDQHVGSSRRVAAAITHCGHDAIALSLSPTIDTAGIRDTEERLAQLVAAGFRDIEVTITDAMASDRAVASMLAVIARRLATIDGQLTICSQRTDQIG